MAKTLSRVWNNKATKNRLSQPVSRVRMHVMFLVLGLLVAFTTYFLLNLSINSLLQVKNNQVTRKVVHSYFDVLDQKRVATDSIGSILEITDPENLPALKEKLSQQQSKGLIDQISYVGFYYSLGDQSILDVLYATSSDVLVTDDGEALGRVLNDPRLTSETAQIYVGQDLFKEQDLEHNGAFTFVKKINVSFADEAYVLVVSHFDMAVGNDWLVSQPLLGLLDIRHQEGGKQVYLYQSSSDARGKLHDVQMHEFAFGGTRWFVKTQFRKDNITAVLEVIPVFGILVILLVTVFAFLYVYLQQKQSLRVRQMNIELEDKNAALEHEIEKRETLNRNLKKSEEENRAVIDSIGDIIFETNIEGDLLYVNASWPRITGFSVMQSKGKNLFNLLHPDDQEKERERFNALVRGQKSAYRIFSRLRTHDGTFRAIELSISMMRRSSEGTTHVVGAITDVEERRRAEQALGEAEKKYRAIVENAAWGIFQMTPEGMYLSANNAMVEVLGYQSTDQMLHGVKNAHEQVYGNEAERKAFLREVDMRGVVNNNEVQIFNRHGQAMWVAENIRAVKDDENNILYYEGSVEDITDRKEADLMLREAKLHSDMANRAKSEFLTNMSHELRTPLNAIIGFSDIIKSETFGALGHESYNDYVNDIHRSGKSLLNVINEILEISRIEVRERDLDEEVVSVPDIIDSCLQLLGNKVQANQIEVMNMIEHCSPLIAEGRALKQVFMNILSNAIKFTPRGGRVTLRYEETDAGDAIVSVTDTGIGLEPDEIKKALSPFGQVGSTLDTNHAGTGLGLTLVKALVGLHDGKLEIFSQKGMGTTVSVKFPAKRVQRVLEKQSDHIPYE